MRRIAILTTTVLLLTSASLAAGEVSHPFTTTAMRGQARRVFIDLPYGEVRIRNGASDRIVVRGTSSRRFDSHRHRLDEQRIADDISAEVFVKGVHAIIRRHFGPNAQSWNAQGHHSSMALTVELPPGVDVYFSTRYGNIDIDGAFGNIDTDLRAGEVHVRTPRANVRDLTASVSIGEVHTYFGDHFIENEGVLPRPARFHNERGTSAVNVHSTFGEVHVTLTR